MATSLATRYRHLLLFCLLCLSGQSLADSQILIVTTLDSDYQQQLSHTIQTGITESGHEAGLTEASQLNEQDLTSKELVVALGKDSVTIIRKNSFKTAIMDTLMARSGKMNGTSQVINEAVIHMTQPMCRQFGLIKALNQNWKTVGLLMSEKNDTRASTLSACARKYDISTRIVTADENSDLITALNTVLSNSDVLLSLADPDIYNSRSIKSILLTSYRHKVPIIGFSESFVNAGAIAAVHTSAPKLGAQINEIILGYFKNGKSFSQSEYHPSDFTVTTNQQVARSMGIKIQDSEAIEAMLIKLESGHE